MKTFTFTLNCQADAVSIEQAHEIAAACKAVITAFHDHYTLKLIQPYKVEVEIDDVEEL